MIEIRNLTKVYGATTAKANPFTALHNVSLTIDDGDIFGIIGMSGAGKSTLLRCLCLLEPPTAGGIYMNGKNICELQGIEKRKTHQEMGVVFQGYNLLMQKNVFDNVAFPLKIAKFNKAEINERVVELLQLVGLADKAEAYPSQLSGGQKQRVALARALATKPNVLLCDEPTSALDSLTTKSVLKLLKNINKELGVTIIIITHDIFVVKEICSHVAVIDYGEFVEIGSQKEVFEKPKSEITKLLLGKEENL